MNDSNLKDIELRRARYAHDFIKKVINNYEEKGNKSDKDKDKYKEELDKLKGYIRKTPALIVSNGLLKTLLYIKSRKTEGYGEIYKFIESWYNDIFKDSDEKNIIEALVKSTDAFNNMRITKEILELMNWGKRFAESLIVLNLCQ